MNRDLTFVSLALVTWGIGEGMFLYFEPLYMQQLGADPVQIGAILGGVGAAMTVAHLPAGYLADRFGRRPVLTSAWIIGAAATWMMALSPSLAWFVAGSALYAFTSFVATPLNSYVTAARGSWSVGRALTLLSATFNFGAILGPLIGGWIGQTLGLRQTFYVSALVFMLSTAIILMIRSQPVHPENRQRAAGGLRGLLTPAYTRFLALVFITILLMYLPQPLSQNFLQNERGVDLIQMGTLISVRYVGIVLFSLFLGRLVPRRGFMLAQAGMALCALLLWRGTGLPWYFAGYFLMGTFQAARYLAAAQGRSLLTEANMGVGYGLIETVGAMAAILAPPLAGLLYAWRPVAIYPISAALIGLSVLLVYLFMRPMPAEAPATASAQNPISE